MLVYSVLPYWIPIGFFLLVLPINSVACEVFNSSLNRVSPPTFILFCFLLLSLLLNTLKYEFEKSSSSSPIPLREAYIRFLYEKGMEIY